MILASIYLILLSESVFSSSAENWVLVWQDEFNTPGLPDNQKWSYDVGGDGWGNNELQFYTNKRLENARIEDSALIIETRKETFSGKNYTSARLVSKGKGDWLYGKVEVRAKLPSGKGTWPAIWMLPTFWEYGNWPASGEIDIMEHVGYDPGVIHATVHTADLNHTKGTQVGKNTIVEDCMAQYHVYSVEWYPDHIDAFIDGKKYFSFSNRNEGFSTWPFDKKFHLLLNTAFGGDWGGAQGIDSTIVSTLFYVDYVRVYQLSEEGPVSLNVNNTTGGEVTVDPLKSVYASGDKITVTALADSGYQFQSWTGDILSNANPLTVNIIRDISLKANFTLEGEMVIDGSFNNGLNSWSEWSNTGTVAKREVSDGTFKISITEAGSNDWDLQLSQAGMKMIAGNKYHISFKAWAQASRTIVVRINMTVPPHSAWYSQTVSLSNSPQIYTVEFTMADQDDSNARIEFDFGKSAITTYIDDVSLKNLSSSETNYKSKSYSSGNQIFIKTPEKRLFVEDESFINGYNLLGRKLIEKSIRKKTVLAAKGIYLTN
ncbi:MAG: family 16 glycosylhydrolase [Chitinispirillaceae bacterium]|nr:family 16 glycosylhydrolase [Chitinispirillaceae bacterium]